MKRQVLESPFTKKEFLDLVDQISEPHDIKHEDFAISKTSIVNIGSREFVDYRPSIVLKKEILENRKINSVDFDSLHFFQIQDLAKSIRFKSLKVKKTDISVNLALPETYKDYLQNLTKKKRHELNRKKRKFLDEIESFELKESKDQDIFDIFIF